MQNGAVISQGDRPEPQISGSLLPTAIEGEQTQGEEAAGSLCRVENALCVCFFLMDISATRESKVCLFVLTGFQKKIEMAKFIYKARCSVKTIKSSIYENSDATTWGSTISIII